MVICGVVASESLLTYDSVRSGGIPRSALHLTIPEQAPTPQYSDGRLTAGRGQLTAQGQPAGHALDDRHPAQVIPDQRQPLHAGRLALDARPALAVADDILGNRPPPAHHPRERGRPADPDETSQVLAHEPDELLVGPGHQVGMARSTDEVG